MSISLRGSLGVLKDRLRSEELEKQYGKDFADEMDAEVARLLEVRNSSFYEMADERFSARELAEASALLRVLFRHR